MEDLICKICKKTFKSDLENNSFAQYWNVECFGRCIECSDKVENNE